MLLTHQQQVALDASRRLTNTDAAYALASEPEEGEDYDHQS